MKGRYLEPIQVAPGASSATGVATPVNVLGSVLVDATSYVLGAAPLVLVDDTTAGAEVTLALPAVALAAGFYYHVKKLGNSFPVVVEAAGSELIDGANTATLTTQYEAIKLYCDGTQWWIL